MGQPNLGRRSGLSVGLLDWMAGLGCDPRRYRMEASTRACVARAGSPAAGTVSGPRAASRADFCARGQSRLARLDTELQHEAGPSDQLRFSFPSKAAGARGE